MSALLRCVGRYLCVFAALVFAPAVVADDDAATTREPKPKVSPVTQAAYYTSDPAPKIVGPRLAKSPRPARGNIDTPFRRSWSPYRPMRSRSVLRQRPIDEDNPTVDAPPTTETPPPDRAPVSPKPEVIEPGRAEPNGHAPLQSEDDGAWFVPGEGQFDESGGEWEGGEGEPWYYDEASEDGSYDEDDAQGYFRPHERWFWENFSATVGVHGFKTPVDRNINGNFGNYYGINWGLPFWDRFGIGAQIGVEAHHSNFEGGSNFDDTRSQVFLTTGLFRRPPGGCGLQGGVAVDYLHDDFFVSMDVSQLRAEISYCGKHFHEIGFWTANQLSNDTDFISPGNSVAWETTDLYAIFYRFRFSEKTSARIWGGATRDGDGIFGGDATAWLSDCWSLQGRFGYRAAGRDEDDEEQEIAGVHRENFAVSVGLVWTPGRRNSCSHLNPYRPLFHVADNSTLLLDLDEEQDND